MKAGLESSKTALLVLIAGLADGTKVVLAVESRQRESTESWAHVLRESSRPTRRSACARVPRNASQKSNAPPLRRRDRSLRQRPLPESRRLTRVYALLDETSFRRNPSAGLLTSAGNFCNVWALEPESKAGPRVGDFPVGHGLAEID